MRWLVPFLYFICLLSTHCGVKGDPIPYVDAYPKEEKAADAKKGEK